MKIAIFHELDSGGAKRVVNEFVKRLDKVLDIDLYYVGSNEDRQIVKNVKNIFYYPFYPKPWKGNDWRTRIYKDTVELYNLYRLHKKIAQDIKSKDYQYIFIHPSKYTQAPFLLRLLNNCIYYCQEPLRIVYDPAIANLKNIPFPKNLYELINRKIRKWIDKKNFKNASIVLANSNFSKKFIRKSYKAKAAVCYLGVDTDFFRPLNLKKTIDVLFIGNRKEGYGLLNKLSEKFKNEIRIKAIFRDAGESGISDKDLLEIYNKSKVLAALNHNEPFGLIPLEAMACGIPVIAVDEGGYTESVVDGKTGFLIPRNLNTFYEKIEKLMKNDQVRVEMGKNARENILQNWTWNKSIERFLKIIKYEK